MSQILQRDIFHPLGIGFFSHFLSSGVLRALLFSSPIQGLSHVRSSTESVEHIPRHAPLLVIIRTYNLRASHVSL